MTGRTEELREKSLAAIPSISAERALILTQFYRENEGRHPLPILRARAFYELCKKKTLWMGEQELIVGERGPEPKAVPTYPELTCHSIADLEILDSRPKTSYKVGADVLTAYKETVIPYWSGRSMREKMFSHLSQEWLDAYDAGVFTEFMEQRAPGHTVGDGKLYKKGIEDFKVEIALSLSSLDYMNDLNAIKKRHELEALDIAADAIVLFAKRHAELARERAEAERVPLRKAELLKIAEVCEHVPLHAPRNFHEALQAYWFYHIAVISELNGWDAFSPGHLDQHLWPFYQAGIADGSLSPETARELLECFFIKFNNHSAPPKVGVTAQESGTYTDFANINIGGLLPDGSDGSNELSILLLDIIDEMHLLQPSSNVQISRKTPDRLLLKALDVIKKGYGFPSVFNADAVVEEQLRQGKSLEDAREGGCSGCVEVGAFGKEAYILTGYFNLMKVLELTIHDGLDPASGKQLGPRTGSAESFKNFDELYAAFEKQMQYFLDVKIRGNQIIGRLYAENMPHLSLSLITDDCIKNGIDYNAGGARYNNTFIQAVGIGSITDSLAAIDEFVFSSRLKSLAELRDILARDFAGEPELELRARNLKAKYGNDNDDADSIMQRVFQSLFTMIDGRPDSRGGHYRLEMLPTTSHVYFGSVCMASADGRKAGMPLSEGISPVQGADRHGPTAVLNSAARMDHIKTGGTLLNMKFTPELLAGDAGMNGLKTLVRTYFQNDGHHIQFNVVSAEMLRKAKKDPASYRNLIVRVAGYSDYFCDLPEELQDEIIARTEHKGF